MVSSLLNLRAVAEAKFVRDLVSFCGGNPGRLARPPAMRGMLASADERFRTFSRLGTHLCFGDEALVRYGAVLAPARLSFPLATKLIGTVGINGKEACAFRGRGRLPTAELTGVAPRPSS